MRTRAEVERHRQNREIKERAAQAIKDQETANPCQPAPPAPSKPAAAPPAASPAAPPTDERPPAPTAQLPKEPTKAQKLEDEVKELLAKVGTLENENSVLQQKLDSLAEAEDNDAHLQSIETLNEQIRSLEGANAEANKEITKLRGQVTRLSNKVKKLEGKQ